MKHSIFYLYFVHMKNLFCLSVQFSALLFLLFLTSCKTYTMSREQLYSQIHNATPKEVKVCLSYNTWNVQKYKGNGVENIECKDNKGQTVIIPNSPKVEMKIIDNRNHNHIFYFDSILLEDSTFTGFNSRFLYTTRSIKYSDIKKVELQKGAKKYIYVE